MMHFIPTAEQNAITQAIIKGLNLKVKAFAGASKTTTLVLAAKKIPNKRLLYITFNSAVAKEGRSVFPGNVTCLTAHALAKRYTIDCYPQLNEKFNRGNKSYLSKLDIQKHSCIPDTWAPFGHNNFQACLAVSLVLENYLNSPDLKVCSDHIPEAIKSWSSNAARKRSIEKFELALIRYAQQLVDEMFSLESECPITHNGYLKFFDIMQVKLPFDGIFVDEAQDTNPVIHSVISNQSCQVVWVGDKHQEIYAWRNAINSLDFINCEELALTKSFRFGEHIAKEANAYLQLLGEERTLVGGGSDHPVNKHFYENEPYTVICRTNIKVLEVAEKAIAKNKTFNIIGGTEALRKTAESAYYLFMGDTFKVKDIDLKLFKDWDEFVSATNALNKVEWKFLIKFIQTHKEKTLSILSSIESSTEASRGKQIDISITTAHKCKGLGFRQVVLASDFEMPAIDNDNYKEILNLIYVAITRAKEILILPKSLPQLCP